MEPIEILVESQTLVARLRFYVIIVFVNTLQLFYRFLFSRRAESLIRSLARLAVMATFISVSALILVISIMNGFNRNIENKVLAVEPHISLSNPKPDDSKLIQDHFGAGVTGIVEYLEQDLILRTVDGLFAGGVARGLSQDSLERLLGRLMAVKGDGSSVFFDQSLEANEVFVGADLARSLNIFQGDELTLVPPESLLLPSGEIPNLERVRVKGLLQTDVATFDSKVLIYAKDLSLKRMQNTSTIKRILEMRLAEPNQHVSVRQDLIKELKFSPEQVETWASRNSSLFFALKLERIAMLSLLALSVLITSFSVVMVLLIFVAEKQKDIGLLMALGLSRDKTKRLFSRLGFYLAMSGSSMGILLGVALALYIEVNPIQLMPDVYIDSTLPAEVKWAQVGWVAVGVGTLCFFASWLPIQRAIRLTPSDAIRGLQAYRRQR